MRSYTSIYNELVLRTQVNVINGEKTNLFDLFTDDSLNKIKRNVYTDSEAYELGLKTEMKNSDSIGYNAYPCTKGLIMKDNVSKVSLG